MVTQPEAHDVTVTAPWYAPNQRNVAMHRYLDAGFVAQFQADASNAPAGRQDALFGWEAEDRMPAAQGGLLKLRRPVHRTFYIVAWEAFCALPTLPAIAAEKIDSAGFVIRTDVSGAPQGFQIVQGKPQGWGPVDTGDPDAARQIKALGLVPQSATANPGYTGEETFPLHPLPVQDGGKPHTLLFGYLPIGGGDYVAPTAQPAGSAETDPLDLPWPFGVAGRSSGPPSSYGSDQQISDGVIQSPMAALLRVLLSRYQLVDPNAWIDPANATLIGILGSLPFYASPESDLTGPALRDWAAANPAPGGVTLADVLLDYAGMATGSTTVAQSLLTALLQTDPATGQTALPPSGLLNPSDMNLLVVERAAAQLRAVLRLRAISDQTASATTVPSPKLTSGPAGRYYVLPFVRTVRPDGCPRVYWGQPSDPFAVASPFDPDAARPSLIEMPSLADAKRGAARGATFNMPPDLADLANGLSSSSAVQKVWNGGGDPSSSLGIGFICSFSLPVISICAMISLSIIISLLNIFLGWMAWVKICIPVPKSSSS